ncbi:bifunctional diaminohydroxyphosphoribosylaminopyrimidine deaminase/5-amino-6-(5-phosphoribosylamino)uracil reductase RibD [bacterium]|nr:bifunctional diaminohydroxyphosphoribosylaminopyrimidine deaminase/5-amino-6-(5-phosphoribosylamino)uracil reductase RibD [bacterium]
MNIYEKLMKKCFSLAKKSKGKNLPNPYVAAIVYDEDENKIISEGYHHKFGSIHAEVDAINNAGGNTINKTLIVNLEPCSHYGKTPPCTDLIIKSKIKKVVFAHFDPNKNVHGEKILKQNGIEVISGILEKEAKDLNKIFIKNQTQKKPYIMLKTATTQDSKIALLNGNSKWITNELSRKYVHKLRNEYCAIMTGAGCVKKDNPYLTSRIKNSKNPIRIIFDPNNKLDLSYNVFCDDNTPIFWVNNSNIKTPNHIQKLNFKDISTLLTELYQKGIYSIMIEAGKGLNSLLLNLGEVDEINHFIAPKIFGSGINFIETEEIFQIKDAIELYDIKTKKFGDDILINAKIKKEKK